MKKSLAEFLVDLCDDVPAGVVESESGDGLGVATFALRVPIESQINPGGELEVCLPRGRLATGFDMPHGRLRVAFARCDA